MVYIHLQRVFEFALKHDFFRKSQFPSTAPSILEYHSHLLLRKYPLTVCAGPVSLTSLHNSLCTVAVGEEGVGIFYRVPLGFADITSKTLQHSSNLSPCERVYKRSF